MKAKKITVRVVQGLLSVSLLMAGVMKIMTPYEELVVQMSWAKNVSPFVVTLIGTLEVLGVVGMNLPFVFNKFKQLIPIAAGSLALTMLVAVFTHLLLGENFVAPMVLLVLAGYVTLSRFKLLKAGNSQVSV